MKVIKLSEINSVNAKLVALEEKGYESKGKNQTARQLLDDISATKLDDLYLSVEKYTKSLYSENFHASDVVKISRSALILFLDNIVSIINAIGVACQSGLFTVECAESAELARYYEKLNDVMINIEIMMKTFNASCDVAQMPETFKIQVTE